MRPRVNITRVDLLGVPTSHEIASRVAHLAPRLARSSRLPHSHPSTPTSSWLPLLKSIRRNPDYAGVVELPHNRPVRGSCSSLVAVAVGSACEDMHVRIDRALRTESPRKQ